MKKSELRTGMVVTLRDGMQYMVFIGMRTIWTEHEEDVLVSTTMDWGWNGLENYNEDLTYGGPVSNPRDWDIVRVEMFEHPCSLQGDRVRKGKRKLLWEVENADEVIAKKTGLRTVKLTKEHFVKSREIKAVCTKSDMYIDAGEEYTVRYMEKRNKVSVPLGSNPHLKRCNGGIEYALSRFVVMEEVEEDEQNE